MKAFMVKGLSGLQDEARARDRFVFPRNSHHFRAFRRMRGQTVDTPELTIKTMCDRFIPKREEMLSALRVGVILGGFPDSLQDRAEHWVL